MKMRYWLSIAWRSVKRRKLRTALSALSVAVGVAMIIGLLSLTAGMGETLRGGLRGLKGADIVVYNASRPGAFGGFGAFGRGFAVPRLLDYSAVSSEIMRIPGVYAVSPVLSFSTSIGGTRITVYGVDASTFSEVSSLTLVEGRLISGPGEAVVGRALADELNLSLGSQVVITYNTSSQTFSVVGIFEAGNPFQEYAVYIPLEDAWNLTGLYGYVSQIQIKCADPSAVSSVAESIRSLFPELGVFTPTQILQSATQLIQSWNTFFLSIGLIALTAGGFAVMNTMFMNVAERVREIGILKSMGAKSLDVFTLFILEALLIGAIGAAAGVLGGVALSFYIPTILPRIPGAPGLGGAAARAGRFAGSAAQSMLRPVVTPYVITVAVGAGLLVTFIAALYPSLRASRMRVVEALRYVF